MEEKPEAAPTLQSIPLMKIFILQLVGLVLTYNFTDCDFEKIRKKYQEVIYQALNKYMNGVKSTEFNNYIYCEDPRGGSPRREKQVWNSDQATTSGTPLPGCRASAGRAPPLGRSQGGETGQPDCLAKIDLITFYPTHGCTTLAKEIFAIRTNATLTLQCPGYSGTQINNTQAKKKRKKRQVTTNKCLEQVSHLMELWRRFSRIS
ncbi:thymic stromal lymphopoietin [Prionailurus iriomotensis]